LGLGVCILVGGAVVGYAIYKGAKVKASWKDSGKEGNIEFG